MINNKIIVIGGSHHNTLGLLRSIGEVGCKPILILEPCDPKHDNTSHCKYISKTFFLNDISELTSLLVEKCIDQKNKSIILCGSDTSISELDNHYNELKDYFFIFNAGCIQGRINYLMDKVRMQEIAKEYGLNLIKTWNLSLSKNLPKDLTFPCILKPINSLGGVKEDIIICENHNSINEALKSDIDYIAQEFIKKDFEILINGVSINHGNEIIIPGIIRKYRQYPAPNGMCSFCAMRDLSEFPFVEIDKMREFIKGIRYEGLFSIECLIKDRNYYFLEINMRNDGTGYIPTAAGVNLHYMWCEYASGSMIDTVRSSSRLPFYFMCETTDIRFAISKEISWSRWIKDLLKTRCFYIINLKDPQPFFTVIRNGIKRLFKK